MSFAALYPGQGSQQVGMGKFLFDEFKIAQTLFEEASDALSLDFKKLCFTGDEATLALTENTQPALLLVSTATYQCLKEIAGLEANIAAGHSIGEYAAVVNAGAMSFDAAIKAVRRRGEEMQKAVPVGEGAMCAVMGLTPEQAQTLCKWAEEQTQLGPIEPANFNAPGQIVLSGNAKVIHWLSENFKKDIFTEEPRRVKFIPLKVSAPFHCSLMKPAQEAMGQVLNDIPFRNATHAIMQNFTASPTQKSDELRNNLIRQISGPVRWVECVQKLKKSGISKAIEYGNGKVIAGLVKKIDADIQMYNTNTLEDLKQIESTVKEFLHA